MKCHFAQAQHGSEWCGNTSPQSTQSPQAPHEPHTVDLAQQAYPILLPRGKTKGVHSGLNPGLNLALAIALSITGSITLITGLLAGLSQGAWAQGSSYPAHSLRLIIPAAPGGAVDSIARVLADKMTLSLGKPVVTENRPGVGTMLASEMLANSAPDGYTLLMMTSSHAINAALRKTSRFDPITDFATISLVATAPDLLVVNAASPINTVADLLKEAKRNPGKLAFGSAGPGSYSHLDAELLKSMVGIEMLHVPYKGGIPAVSALLANETQLMFLSIPGLIGQIKAGKLKALAITSKERSAMLPDTPTLQEAGVPGYLAQSWYGLVAPGATSGTIITLLNQRVNDALKLPSVRERLANAGVEAVGTTPTVFATTLKEEINRWQKLVEASPELKLSE